MRAVLFLAVAGVISFPATSLAQSTDPAWLETLQEEIALEKQCEISHIMNLREGQLGGKPTYEARVACVDGRMFDASRVGTAGFFEFKACEIQAC